MGLYFTAKARSASLREKLFGLQLDLCVRILSVLGRIRVFATILSGNDDFFKEQARLDIGEKVRKLSEMEMKVMKYPTELWVQLKRTPVIM